METDDPGLYARSFASVYDHWYADLDDASAVTDALTGRLPVGSTIIELGSGTGRIAQPLVEAGFTVIGVDISTSMLDASAAGELRVAADMRRLPVVDDAADAVVVGYNTLCNLTSVAAQRACLAEIARCLRPGGIAAIETFVLATASDPAIPVPASTHPTIEVSHRRGTNPGDRVIMLSSVVAGSVPGAHHITGTHIECRPDVTVSRPWRLCHLSERLLDATAQSVGLALTGRFSDWSGSPLEHDASRQVSWYLAG